MLKHTENGMIGYRNKGYKKNYGAVVLEALVMVH